MRWILLKYLFSILSRPSQTSRAHILGPNALDINLGKEKQIQFFSKTPPYYNLIILYFIGILKHPRFVRTQEGIEIIRLQLELVYLLAQLFCFCFSCFLGDHASQSVTLKIREIKHHRTMPAESDFMVHYYIYSSNNKFLLEVCILPR